MAMSLRRHGSRHRARGRLGVLLGILLPAALASSAVVVTPAHAAVLPVPAPVEQRTAQTMTADALPTVQINDGGIVWAQAMIGHTVYAGGKFTSARPAGVPDGTDTTPRGSLLAYDIRTGLLNEAWQPAVNGTVKAVAASPDGTRVYVGGSFNTANGQTRWNIAAFDATTGALLSTFRPAVGGSYVNAIVATSDVVYVGGLLGAGNGVTRKNLMAFSTSGQLLGWAPTTDLQVDSMVRAPGTDNLVVGGRFATVNGVTQRGLVALSLADGSIQPWIAPSVIRNGAGSGTYMGKAGIYSLSTDGVSVFGTGWVYAPPDIGNLEGLFSAQSGSGAVNWVADCHGDHYSAYSDGAYVYSTSHEHSCDTMGGYPQKNPAPGNMHNATAVTAEAKGTLAAYTGGGYANWAGTPAPAAVTWYPDWYTGTASGQGQAGWTIVGTDGFMSVGGEFRGVNGKAQYGLVRFASAPPDGAHERPQLSGDAWVPALRSPGEGLVRASIPTNYDRDDMDLRYELLRSGTALPVAATQLSRTFWQSGTVTLTDATATPGRTYTYTVRAVDGDGNAALSKAATVTVSATPLSTYVRTVVGDGALLYWRLGQGSGTVPDLVGAGAGTAGDGISVATPGAIVGDPDAAARTSGTSSGLVATNALSPVSASFSAEAWFRTTTSRGGKIFGYGSSRTGYSSNYDRHVYMTNAGRLVFGTFNGTVQTITSGSTYNDGAWHHVVASQSPDGMRLYVDGALVGTHPGTQSEGFTGYWRVGGDSLSSWPSPPSSVWFDGSVDEFAVYGAALSDDVVRRHSDIGRGALPPTASFTAAVGDQEVALDASASSAAPGSWIAGYEWDLGDGTSATGVTARHTYAAPGTYLVSLTVTDTAGRTATTTRTVTATAPHAKPVAAFTAASAGLTTSFDAGGSRASDGATVRDYAWSFGDGQTGTGATPTHTYAAAGTYTVTLRVTDSQGSVSDPTSHPVTATHADPVPSFTVSAPPGLVVGVDAAASTGSDGARLAYEWDWGDAGPGSSGVSASHTYAADGTYTVTLTVRDSLGASASMTRRVSVAAPTVRAGDSFARTLDAGWGSADVGGPWSTGPGLSVGDGVGVITVDRTQTRAVTLSGLSVADTDSRFTVATDTVADGGGVHVNYGVRVTTAGAYRVKLRYAATGTVTVSIARLSGTTETLLANKVLPGFTQAPGSVLDVRLLTETGATGTSLRAKVWPHGAVEPDAWFLSSTDATPALQSAGAVGLSAYGTGTMTNGPVRVLVDDLEVR